MDRKLLDLLVCPRTHQPLDVLDSIGLQQVNDAIAAGTISRIDGQVQDATLREALVSEDRRTVYRVDDGIPVLLVDEGLAMHGILQR